MMNSIPNHLPSIRPTDAAGKASEAGKAPGNSAPFATALRDAIGQAEKLQAEAQTSVAELLQGQGQDIHQTMIAVEKADLSFQLMMQVRNKIVQAYQEIYRMSF